MQSGLRHSWPICKRLFSCSMPESRHISTPSIVHEMCNAMLNLVGGLDELESSLAQFSLHLTPALFSQVLDCCKSEGPGRRILRFIRWARKTLGPTFSNEDFNTGLRVVAEKNDPEGIEILLWDMRKEGRVMELQSFAVVANVLIGMGRQREALGIFKNLEKFKLSIDGSTVVTIVAALCRKGHAKEAQGIMKHHNEKVSTSEMLTIYKCLLYGWSLRKQMKEARNVLKEMKKDGIVPDIFCYNTYLKGLCERNVVRNHSGLVPDSMNVLMEMRSHRVEPNSITYNTLLSCLGRVGRVKEACRVFDLMKRTGCSANWVSYYHVVKVLFLSGRFGMGAKMIDEMIGEGIAPERKFYYNLIKILCKLGRLRIALELLEKMKMSSLGGYGPVYDMLIPKVCEEKGIEKGQELWNEAIKMDVSLSFSCNMLVSSVTNAAIDEVRDDELENNKQGENLSQKDSSSSSHRIDIF